jgi:hypothetical protein
VPSPLALVPALVSSALTQGAVPADDDPFLPAQNTAVVEDDAPQQIAGQPLPKQLPSEPLPQTSGLENVSTFVILSAAALLLGSSVVAYYTVLRKKRRS